ncbi:BnaAnng09820D [Brassica napus]|uniref:BnaAnng09820D protein n=1 Tax=Brassica napus TaxID=3708 RepID=A0A078IEK8_BRANA|nr:BnaAnng09820D [Brassica napus]
MDCVHIQRISLRRSKENTYLPAAGLMDMIKPDLMRIDGNVPSTMRAVNDMNTKIGGQISLALKEAVGTSTHPPAVPIVTPTAPRNPVGGGSNIQVQEVGVADGRQNVGAEANVTIDPQNNGTALSASSHTHMRKDGVNEIKVPDNATKEQVPETPSFSLGLTQQEKSPCNEQLGTVRLAADLNVAHDEGEDNVEGNNVCRKSKRQKIFPSNLMADYECRHNIVGHGCQAPMLLFVLPDSEVTITKFQQLGEKLMSSL